MNVYLKSAVSRFNKLISKEYKISPMSELDAEINTEIYEIFKKLSVPPSLLGIIQKYKYLSDEDIRDKLLDFNVNFKYETNEGSNSDNPMLELLTSELKEAKKRFNVDFVEINGKRFRVTMIYGYEPVEIDNLFYIRLNPTPVDATKLPAYSNEMLEFYSYEERDSTLDLIDELVKFLGGRVQNIEDFGV